MEEFLLTIRIPATVVHVLSVVLAMGSALTTDALFSFYGKKKRLEPSELATLDFLSKLVLAGLGVVFISGAILFFGSMEEYMNSSKFLSKMTILLVLLINGFFLNKFIWPHLLTVDFFTAPEKRGVRRFAFASGAVSVISWLLVCILGVLNRLNMSYTDIISIYLGIIVFGIVVALLVEKHELD